VDFVHFFSNFQKPAQKASEFKMDDKLGPKKKIGKKREVNNRVFMDSDEESLA
jgi:hypothetical protein